MTSNLISQLDANSFDFNVAHVATFQVSLPALASKLNFSLHTELDDLDEFEVGYLQLSDGFRFYLSKYKSRPSNTTEVFFASRLNDWEARLEQISTTLGISSSDLVWKNDGYMKTP
ncbi:hypothetical protein AB4142_19365 [Variovorax sp. 2RAF20]